MIDRVLVQKAISVRIVARRASCAAQRCPLRWQTRSATPAMGAPMISAQFMIARARSAALLAAPAAGTGRRGTAAMVACSAVAASEVRSKYADQLTSPQLHALSRLCRS